MPGTTSRPPAPAPHYFQALLEALRLSGHYLRQVEGFYWEQRRTIRRLMAVRPDMTQAQAQAALKVFMADPPMEAWRQQLLDILLADADLVSAAFDDVARAKQEREGRQAQETAATPRPR